MSDEERSSKHVELGYEANEIVQPSIAELSYFNTAKRMIKTENNGNVLMVIHSSTRFLG